MLGLAWFLVTMALSLGLLRNKKLAPALLAWSLVGLVGVVGLVYIELFLVGAICPVCTSAHLLGLGVLVLAVVIWRKQRIDPLTKPRAR